MNYKLALKLKENGFPQKNFGVGKHYHAFKGESKEILYEAYTPTLEELIFECGKMGATFSALKFENGTWCASGFNNEKDIWEMSVGPTPLIAVAHLWLALNKNNTYRVDTESFKNVTGNQGE